MTSGLQVYGRRELDSNLWPSGHEPKAGSKDG